MIRLNEAEAYWLQQISARLYELKPDHETNRLRYKFERAPLAVSLTRPQREHIREMGSFRLDQADCVLESERTIIQSIISKCR